ncbi:uncharacterized protein [Nicotiana sylvestris]|uniref:uncharacterized protein n=1 Tax=Nicotiana sylvestris TaxID=4096 RepID=UPI00388CD726
MKMLKRELRKLNTQSFRNIVSEANEDRTALQNIQEQLHLDPDNLELQQTEKEKYQKLRKSSYLSINLLGYDFPLRFVRLVMECVTYPKYSIIVNGEGHGYFEGQEQSVRRVMEALNHFTRVTRLIENMEKSNIFIAGVDDHTKATLLSITGFLLGAFPIRYLGFLLSPKKWNKLECHQLIEKITRKIQNGYAKQLSYAGRLQIINTVIFSIHNFWGAVFILS